MRFKLDENLPAEAADLLRDAGYDAVTVLEQEMSGETDASVAAVCEQEGRVLVTLDTISPTSGGTRLRITQDSSSFDSGGRISRMCSACFAGCCQCSGRSS